MFYQGEVDSKGRYDGRGIYLMPNDCIMFANWKQGKRHGRCIFFGEHGQKMTGECVDGEWHGTVRVVMDGVQNNYTYEHGVK